MSAWYIVFTDQVPDVLLFDTHEYADPISQSVILVSIFQLRVSIFQFLQSLLDRVKSYFRRNAFEELACYLFLTFKVTSFFPMKTSSSH